MFKINQILHSINKIDTGLVIAFCSCYLCYEYDKYLTYILSVIYISYMFVYLLLSKKGMKSEYKKIIVIPFIIRVILISLNGIIIYLLIQTDHDYFKENGKYIIIINSFLSFIMLILECFLITKSISNFGKGLKEMMESQEALEYSVFDSGTSVNSQL